MRILPSILGITVFCLVPGSAQAEQLGSGINDLDLTRLVTGLNQPTGAVFLPDGRLVILEKGGDLKVQMPGGSRLINAGTLPTNEISIEQGGLGIAVDPMFATSNRLYFYYSRGNTGNDMHAIGWATISPSTNQVDVNNITNVLTGIYGPANHNGGGLKFGPDGYLYVGTGDTGCNCSCSPGNADNYNSTCLTNFQGKILRIDRDGNAPSSNPLVNVASVKACPISNSRPCQSSAPTSGNMADPAPEIYNWGFRNVWRFSWDEQTGFLWIGDVGEVTWEEITVSQGPGEHHGWPFREGAHGRGTSECGASTPSSGPDCVDPAYEYDHSESPARGQGSVTAGVFSNHCSWPSNYRGKYWFGDYNKGRIWTVTPDSARTGVVSGSRETIVTSAGGPVHFMNGPDHAVYAVDIDNGRIYRLAPTNPVPCNDDGGSTSPPDGGSGTTGEAGVDVGVPTFLDAQPGSPDRQISDTDIPPYDSGVNGPGGEAGVAPSPDATSTSTTPNNGKRVPSMRVPSTCGCEAVNTQDDAAKWGLLLLLGAFITRIRRRK